MGDVFFLIGAARSGTTAYASILDTATNATMNIESFPRLRIESREFLKGNLPDPVVVLKNAKEQAICDTLKSGCKYGDKNPCYLPFIPHLIDLWDSKIVFLVRDGRDVVRSLMDWHHLKAHNIFVMHEDDDGSLLKHPEDDPWDYSRLRPNPEDTLFDSWKTLSRFEKCAWYWANFNRVGLNYLSQIPPDRWMLVDVTRSDITHIQQVFEFLELTGFEEERIKLIFDARVNSIQDRTGQLDQFPHWQHWSTAQYNAFEKFAGSMMRKLEYW